MKVTRWTKLHPVQTLSTLGGGGGEIGSGSPLPGGFPPSGQIPVSSGSNTWAWGSNIATIWSNSSNQILGPDVNFLSGAGIAFAAASNTLTIINTGTSGGGGGGGGTSGYDLDTYTLDATYGDDFTGASLAGAWTRRNFTSGAETYQLGKNATYMRIAMTSRAAGDAYFRSAPGGDWTFALAYVMRYWPANKLPWSLCVVNTVGTGLGMTMHDSPYATMTAGITTYTTYSGSFQQNTTFGGGSLTTDSRKVWMYLRKSGTDYFGAVSWDGEVWGPETPAFSSAITVDRVGMIVHPLGGITTTAVIEVDWFNKIA